MMCRFCQEAHGAPWELVRCANEVDCEAQVLSVAVNRAN